MLNFSKNLLAFLAAMILASFAHATQPGNNGGGNGGCGVGQQTNGCGGQGGAGGSGGAGGNGLGVGVGVGVGVGIANAAANAVANGGNAAVVGSGNSSVRNNNANVQGQQQGQQQSSRNNNRNQNTANGGAGGAGYGGTGVGGNSGGNNLANSLTVEGDKGDAFYAPAQERNPVATAYAAPLTAANGTCMGSSSAGVQGAALGVSVGTTWKDEDCNGRYDAAALTAVGQPRAAIARLCQSTKNREAMEEAGTPCPSKSAKIGSSNSAPIAVVDAPAQTIAATDLKLLP